MKLAMAQMAMSTDMAENLKKSLRFCEEAKGSDLLFFPEIQLCPFFPQYEKKNVDAYCLRSDAEEIRALSAAAGEGGYYMSPNVYLEMNGKRYDTSLWIDPHGELLDCAKMVHIAQAEQFYEQDYYTPSDDGFKVFDTPFGRVGIVYLADRHRHYGEPAPSGGLTARMLRIAVPLAVSAYARSALSTLQHLLVPRGLKSAGYSADGALSGYGVIQGMVLPIIFFPSCIMAAAAELIVPELTEAQVQGDGEGIHRASRSLLRLSLGFSGAVAAFMFVFADSLGLAIYDSAEAGAYIRVLAPLIPVMYTDMTVDGCLKGLGQQVWSMAINILDAVLGLVLVWTLLPVYALHAYIGIIYFTEAVNFILSILRLRRVLNRRGG